MNNLPTDNGSFPNGERERSERSVCIDGDDVKFYYLTIFLLLDFDLISISISIKVSDI